MTSTMSTSPLATYGIATSGLVAGLIAIPQYMSAALMARQTCTHESQETCDISHPDTVVVPNSWLNTMNG
jgi:hypothetical protein